MLRALDSGRERNRELTTMPNMMENIVMRKCSLSYKKAKQIVLEARMNLCLLEQSMLWSKELEAECIRIHEVDKVIHQPMDTPPTITALIESSKDTTKKSQRSVISGGSGCSAATSSTHSSGFGPVSPLRKAPWEKVERWDMDALESSQGVSPQRSSPAIIKRERPSKSSLCRPTERKHRSLSRARRQAPEDDLDAGGTSHSTRSKSLTDSRRCLISKEKSSLDGDSMHSTRSKSRLRRPSENESERGLDGCSMHSTQSRSRTKKSVPEVSLLDSGGGSAKPRRSKEGEADLDGDVEHAASRSKFKSRRSSKPEEEGMDGGAAQSTRSKSTMRRSSQTDDPSARSTRSRSTTRKPSPEESLFDCTPNLSNLKSRSSSNPEDDEENLDGGTNHTRSRSSTRRSSKTDDLENIDTSKSTARRSSLPPELDGPSSPLERSKSKSRRASTTDAFESPEKSRSKTVTRRLVSAVELETACQADPSLRKAIAKNSGTSCRLGLYRSPRNGKSGNTAAEERTVEGKEDALPISSSPNKKCNATMATRKISKSPTKLASLRVPIIDDNVSLHFADFENLETKPKETATGSKVLGKHLSKTASADNTDLDNKSKSSFGSGGSGSKTSMIPVVKRSSTVAKGSGSPIRKGTSSPVRTGSPSRYRMVPNSPTRANSPIRSPGKSPSSILRNSRAQQMKSALPAPLDLGFGDKDDFFPAASRFSGKESINVAQSSDWTVDPFSQLQQQHQMKKHSDAGPFSRSAKPTRRYAENTSCTSQTADSSHSSVESEKDAKYLFGPATFDSADEIFPEFTKNTTFPQNRSTRDLQKTFVKQESWRSAKAPTPPRRQISSERAPLRKVTRSHSNDSHSSASSGSEKKAVKVRRQMNIKREKPVRMLGDRKSTAARQW